MPTTQTAEKLSGATFTPGPLADYLAGKILRHLQGTVGKKIHVFDPSCGDGALLDAISGKLAEAGIKHSLTGFDINDAYLSSANELLSYRAKLVHGDFLEGGNVDLFNTGDNSHKAFDVAIANPPYVRTQLLGADYSQRLASKFGLKGKVDLYFPFIIEMTRRLKEGGMLGMITSNRYLSTKSGLAVRAFLQSHYDILEVIDLGDTKLFDAAVLPAILIGRKAYGAKNNKSRFEKTYEVHDGVSASCKEVASKYDILQSEKDGFYRTEDAVFHKTSGFVKFSNTKEMHWALLSGSEHEWVETIERNAAHFVKDLFKVRVGIKSTADKVFIKNNWSEVKPEPEEELLFDLISQENLGQWCIDAETSLKVLYPHISQEGKKETVDITRYPAAQEYFENHRSTLTARKYLIDAGRKWYELWVPQRPDFWKFPKLVFPDISPLPRFYYDESGKIVNGNCYWIVGTTPREQKLLRLLQGVANTKLMTRYHDLVFNNKLYSGRRRYMSQYIERYPLPDPDTRLAGKIIETARKLQLEESAKKVKKLKDKLEALVAESFGL